MRHSAGLAVGLLTALGCAAPSPHAAAPGVAHDAALAAASPAAGAARSEEATTARGPAPGSVDARAIAANTAPAEERVPAEMLRALAPRLVAALEARAISPVVHPTRGLRVAALDALYPRPGETSSWALAPDGGAIDVFFERWVGHPKKSLHGRRALRAFAAIADGRAAVVELQELPVDPFPAP